MYVLARRKGESISLANGLIEIKVVSITGNIVRLGFEAPKEVDILRTELIDEKTSKDNGDGN